MRRAMAVGAWVWPLFFLVDLYLGLVAYPAASHTLPLCFVFRLIAEAGIIAVFLLSREEKVTSRCVSTLASGPEAARPLP